MTSNDFETTSVPEVARKGFSSMFVIWLAFQVSTVMLFFGGVTIAHLTFPRALVVVGVAAVLIALVSGLTGYAGARTGMSTALLCEHVFGRVGGRVQQAFQGIIELGWYAVIVGLTGDALNTLLDVDSPSYQGLVRFALGVLFMITVFYGFRGMYWLSVFTTPLIVLLLIAILVDYKSASGGLLWKPMTTGPDMVTSMTIAVGTFITGAALSADLTRFAKTGAVGFWAGFLSFLVSIPATLLFGAAVAMTNPGQPDFIQAVAAVGLGQLILAFLVFANWTSADTTLYLSVVPMRRLTPLSRRILVVVLGLAGSLVAALGVTDVLTVWLTTLSILLPPLAGPIAVITFELFRGKDLSSPLPKFSAGGFLAWVFGVIAAAVSQASGIGFAPLTGIIVSFVAFIIARRLVKGTQRAVPSQ